MKLIESIGQSELMHWLIQLKLIDVSWIGWRWLKSMGSNESVELSESVELVGTRDSFEVNWRSLTLIEYHWS